MFMLFPLPTDAEIVKAPTVLLGTGESISGRINDCKSEYIITADEGVRGGNSYNGLGTCFI